MLFTAPSMMSKPGSMIAVFPGTCDWPLLLFNMQTPHIFFANAEFYSLGAAGM